MLELIVTTKQCTKCEQTKPLVEFHSDASRKDGKCKWCIDCRSQYQRLYRSKPKHTPKTKQCRKCKKVLPISCFYKDSASKDGYGHVCKEDWKDNAKLLRKNDLAHRITKRLSNRAKKYNVAGPKIADIRRLISETFGDGEVALCPITGKPMFIIRKNNTDPFLYAQKDYATIDHKIPISKGGDNSYKNLHFISRQANSYLKRQQTLVEFALTLVEEVKSAMQLGKKLEDILELEMLNRIKALFLKDSEDLSKAS